MLELENIKPLKDFDLDAMDERFLQIVSLAGYDSINTSKAKLLIKHIWREIHSFPKEKKRLDSKVLPNQRAAHVKKIIKTIDILNEQISSLPEEVLKDLNLTSNGHEDRFLDSILEVSLNKYKDFNISYPLIFKASLGKFENAIVTNFRLFSNSNNPLELFKNLIKTTSLEFSKLNKEYAKLNSRGAVTRNAELQLRRNLFVIFDKFYVGENFPVQNEEVDYDYVNSKAEFVFCVCRTFDIPTPSLGKQGNSEIYIYNGRLGQEAKKHCQDKFFFSNQKYYKKSIKDDLKLKKK